jgi:hypothetical protein
MPLMPGMSMASYPPAVAISLFYRALLATAIFFALVVLLIRPWLRRRLEGDVNLASPEVAGWRNLLAYWLGALWVLDGFLQMQPEMVTRFIGGFLAPLLGGQPGWVRAVIEGGMRLWSVSPIWFNVGAALIQLGIGVVILFSQDGAPLRRLALWVSIGWGFVVWACGEAFGSLFSGGGPLVGSPGSVLLYVLAAGLLLLPAERWAAPRFWRIMAVGIAAYFLLMAGLAAWPPNGWWTPAGASYLAGMAAMPQPGWLAGMLAAWASAYAHHPALWNGLIVATSALLGLAWLAAPRRAVLWASLIWVFLVWFWGQDFGVLGGMGTDPNTGGILMVYLFLWGSRIGFVRARAPSGAPEVVRHSPR